MFHINSLRRCIEGKMEWTSLNGLAFPGCDTQPGQKKKRCISSPSFLKVSTYFNGRVAHFESVHLFQRKSGSFLKVSTYFMGEWFLFL